MSEAAAGPSLEVAWVDVGELHEDPANARMHSTRNIDAIKASLARFGQQKPIVVDSKNVVRAGSGTLRAVKELGWPKVGIVRTDLSGSELIAYALADNRTAELATWDFETLSGTLKALRDEDADWPARLGWADYEAAALLNAEWDPPERDDLPERGDADAAPPIHVTVAQRSVIDRAIAAVKEQCNDDEMSNGRALELICADFLAGTGKLSHVPS